MKRVFNIHVFFCAVFTAFTAILVTLALSKVPFLEPVSDSVMDWDFTDLAHNEGSKNQEEIDDRIVLVNISEADVLDREGIALLLKEISRHQPKVIGLDVFFSNPQDYLKDSLLTQVISEIKDIVMVARYFPGKDSIEMSHPMFSSNMKQGLANLEYDRQGTIRKIINRGAYQEDTFRSFASEVVKYYDSEAASEFNERNLEWEWINYQGNTSSFLTLDYFDTSFSVVKDKIVLVGYLGQEIEIGKSIREGIPHKYYTPLKTLWYNKQLPDMYGVVIHANAIKMILDRKYVHSRWFIDEISNMVLIVMAVVLFYFLLQKFTRRYNILARALSLTIIGLVIGMSVFFFKTFHLKIELSFTVLVLLFLPDCLEFYATYFTPAYDRFSNTIRSWLKYSVIVILFSPYILSLVFGYELIANADDPTFRIIFFLISFLWLLAYSTGVVVYGVKKHFEKEGRGFENKNIN